MTLPTRTTIVIGGKELPHQQIISKE